MGCGHSKINIYPKKCRSKISLSKKCASQEKPENEEEESAENEAEANEKIEDCDQRKTIKVKPFGGPLLAQAELSNSQQNFFKMLDEKIDNGPDYDSGCEAEKASEAARLSALLKDWETASAGSRSLPATPKRKPRIDQKIRAGVGIAVGVGVAVDGGLRPGDPRGVDIPRSGERTYNSHITQSVVHQSYGVTQGPYRTYTPVYQNSPPHPSQQLSSYQQSALQYQAISPMYTSQPTYPAPSRQYPVYNPHGSPLKTYSNNSPKHIPYDSQSNSYSSPSHKLYTNAPKSAPSFSNGELIQQQIYNQQLQYQQAREYQQYKQSREQQMLQQQGYMGQRNYQTSVHIPIAMQNPAGDGVSPLHRKQYELT